MNCLGCIPDPIPACHSFAENGASNARKATDKAGKRLLLSGCSIITLAGDHELEVAGQVQHSAFEMSATKANVNLDDL